MSDWSMQTAVQRYLDERRRLGFELKNAGTALMRFARFADARQHRGPLTLEIQLEWAREHVIRSSAITAARRLELLRPFSRYYRQFEPDTEVPPPHILGPSHRRLAPHIYTDQEICDLLAQARALKPQGSLRPLVYETLFGLIAATGMRISEALKLQLADLDLTQGILVVRQTKFNKSRCLPLHESVVTALRTYLDALAKFVVCSKESPVFYTRVGQPLSASTVHYVFAQLRKQLGWTARGDHRAPRIHDLRHTMAVRRIEQWYEEGASLEHAMFWLCTYLGHAKISDTYWYMTGTPQLMDLVGSRFEHFALKEAGHE